MANRWSSIRTEGHLGSAQQPGWEGVVLVDALAGEEKWMGLTQAGHTLLSLAVRKCTQTGRQTLAKTSKGPQGENSHFLLKMEQDSMALDINFMLKPYVKHV